jgi:GNAT superfamily N-acetyltransferase
VSHPSPTLRPVRDEDADHLIALIGAVYDEHPGCVLDLPGLDADLSYPETHAACRGNRWWVVEDAGGIVATVGVSALREDGAVELKRLYVAASHRRQGLASRLVATVDAHAARVGATRLELWSDTRFEDAHRLYTGQGYEATARTRALHDPSNTTEYHFSKPVVPAEPDHVLRWRGPHGADVCEVSVLPDGVYLHGEVEDVDGVGWVRYAIEVDAAWRTRAAAVTDIAGTRRVTSDGAGRWWIDAKPVADLDGCLDADVEATPATNTLPIRRAHADEFDVRAAWLRIPGPDIEPLAQHYTRLGEGRVGYASGDFRAELVVDDDGFVVSYGDLWQRA